MAKSKKTKRARTSRSTPPDGPGARTSAAPGTGAGGPRNPRRPHKEQARQAREAARKRAARRTRIRRLAWFAAVTTVGATVIFFVFVPTTAGSVPQEALDAARAAGCGEVQTPAREAPGAQHLSEGQNITYDQKPATSGQHDLSALPESPRVYDTPVSETQAVHSLEHADVIVYYRQGPPGALRGDVRQRLTDLVQSRDDALIVPYAGLPDGTALALTAWNKLWTCPADISPQQAVTVASGFMDAYAGTNNAPEPPNRIGL